MYRSLYINIGYTPNPFPYTCSGDCVWSEWCWQVQFVPSPAQLLSENGKEAHICGPGYRAGGWEESVRVGGVCRSGRSLYRWVWLVGVAQGGGEECPEVLRMVLLIVSLLHIGFHFHSRFNGYNGSRTFIRCSPWSQ